MNYLKEVEKNLGRPLGVRMMYHKEKKYEAWLLPEHEGKPRDIIFIVRPSWVKRAIDGIKGCLN